MNQISSTNSVKKFWTRLLDSGYVQKFFLTNENVSECLDVLFQMSGLMFSKWLDINFVKINGWSKRNWKIFPASCATVLAKVLREKGEGHGAGEACCGSAAVGIHVRLEGEDRALSYRSAHVLCVNNFACFVCCFMSSDSSTLIVLDSISTLLLWACNGWESGREIGRKDTVLSSLYP